jgi:hypothetical protein
VTPSNPGADEALSTIATLPAGSMTTKSSGSTCGGDCWTLWSNGYIESSVSFPSAGGYRFDVSAYGSYAAGWPNMELRIDGTAVGSATVNSGSSATYTIQANVPSGAHRVTIAFTNDYYAPPDDRNLYVIQTVISGGAAPSVIATLPGSTLWSNGYIENSVTFPGAGSYRFDVSAYGSYAAGWPNMELRIDGAAVGSTTVNSGSAATYTFQANVPSGAHSVAIAFTNDYYAPPDDRNLYVIQTVISGATASTTAGPTSIGCFADQATRDLSTLALSGSVSVESCLAACTQAGYKYAGVQYGQQCFCGNSYGRYGSSTSCNMACTANAGETCGGTWANDVYATGATGGSSCTPTTCAAQGKSCGTISDGCGGTLTCGSCTSPQTCGGGGTPNVCGGGSSTSASGADDSGSYAPPGYHLVWQDLFDSGSVPSSSTWGMYNSPGNAGYGLRRPSAFSVHDGMVDVTAQMVNGQLVSGGMMATSGQTYGYFEFRVRSDPDPSMATSAVVLTWPKDGVWPQHGENDIYETGPGGSWGSWTRDPFGTNIHYATSSGSDTWYHFDNNADGTQWHVMGMEWTPDHIGIYRDGTLVGTVTDPNAIPHVNHNLCIQLDAWSSTMGAATHMYVDWVKVFSL